MNIKLLGSCGIAIVGLLGVVANCGSATPIPTQQSSATFSITAPFSAPFAQTGFTRLKITGFLNPDGFSRPQWQTLNTLTFLSTDRSIEPTFVVMLDPGHGGIDPGSKAHNGLLEKDLTLDIARRVRLFLSEFKDIDVVFTRDHDHGLSRQSRVNAVRNSHADMVISLHFNHLPQTDITLVESYYASPRNIAESRANQLAKKAASSNGFQHISAAAEIDLSFTQGSKRLAHTIQQRVFNEVSFENSHTDNGGVKQETLFVLTRSFTPGVLIELTCLSNIDEAEKLTTDEYRNRLAAALADGIRSYQESLQRAPLITLGNVGT